MPIVLNSIQMRNRRRAKARRNPAGRLGLGCSLLFSLSIAAAAISLGYIYSELSQALPSLEVVPSLLEPPAGLLLQPTRLYDSSGEHILLALENPASAGKRYLYLSEETRPESSAGEETLPKSLAEATVAYMDPAYWDSPRFTWRGLLAGTHATLAQRLVSELLLVDETPGLRKELRERLLAVQLISRFGPAKVLEWYLNSADFGNLAYGADAAARVYFGKPAAQVSLAEAAVLAGILAAPGQNPLISPQAALDRAQDVIQAMLEQGRITAEEAALARQEKLAFRDASFPTPLLAPGFTNLALEQVSAEFGRSRLERGGLRVITSLDYELQLQSECASAALFASTKTVKSETPASGGQECQAALLLPASSLQEGLPAEAAVEVAVLDPQRGRILALSGYSPESAAQLTGRPSGSILTPFIYLAAFTRGLSPGSLAWDTPGELTDIQNFDGQYHGPVSLRVALANDYLVPAAQLLAELGTENVADIAGQFGINSSTLASNPNGSKDFLAGVNVSLLKASQAYGVFSNQGILAGRLLENFDGQPAGELADLSPVAVERVEDLTGRPVLDWNDIHTRPVISPQLAFLMMNVLSDEPARWPSLGHPNALEIGRPAAVKSGRTMSGASTWTIGFTQQFVVGTWVGNPALDETGQTVEEPGMVSPVPPGTAAALWHAIIQHASRDLPAQAWEPPAGISGLQVCSPSGLLPTPDCPNLVEEFYLAGNEPTGPDNLYQTILINRETGLRATVFTPPELVDEQVFLLVPPEAAGWARQAGFTTPPEGYDVIPAATNANPNLLVTAPAPFAFVRGEVAITGKASGEDFAFYRLQVGEGLSPRSWLQVGQDQTRAVPGGQLGAWDTAGLNGLYTIQLLVVRADQRVESRHIQVVVDNQPPEIEDVYPADGQEGISPQSGRITLSAGATDNQSLQNIEFSVDGQRIAQRFAPLDQPPFAVSWQASPGLHTLHIRATDLAGNTAEAESEFEVEQ